MLSTSCALTLGAQEALLFNSRQAFFWLAVEGRLAVRVQVLSVLRGFTVISHRMTLLPASLLFLTILICTTMAMRTSLAADAPAADLKLTSGRAHLFVDDYLISQQNGLVRTLHQPKKDNGGNEPVIALADEFGQTRGTLEANGTILYDPKLKKWVMFTLAFASSWQGEPADRVRLYRF